MANKVQIRGQIGHIKYGYHVAAALHGFTIQRCDSGEWELTGTAVSHNPVHLAQQPLEFVVPVRGWRWALDHLTMSPTGTVHATLTTLKEQSNGTSAHAQARTGTD